MNSNQRRVSREEAMAIKAEVDYHRLNKSFTDVTFIVGPPQHSKKYVGHRVLLAMTSPVFETMFYGDMADKSKYIRIPDVAPIGFENLLRYAYTDTLNLNSVEDAMLTAYAAKKYLLPQLLRECLTYIEHNISPSTACVVFEFAHVLNSQQLVLQAMNLIDRQTVGVVTNKSFRKYLNLSTEFTLFNAIVGWALAEAKRRNVDQDDWRAIRSILNEGTILGAIRFLAMSNEEFARAIARTSASIQEPAAIESRRNTRGSVGGGEQQRVSTDNGVSVSPIDAGVGSEQHELDELGPGESNLRRSFVSKVNTEDRNSLLLDHEQRAVFLNLSLEDVAKLPDTICSATTIRRAPPEYFTVKLFQPRLSAASASSSNVIVTTTTTRNIKSITSKFQCLSDNVFIVALTAPIRLDASSYANRTPKFECHLKFTTRATSSSSVAGLTGGPGQHQHSATTSPVDDLATPTPSGAGQQSSTSAAAAAAAAAASSSFNNESTLLMDTIDESMHISIARDKDCLVRLKRPILIRMGNINELTLTFQTYALDEDLVALRTPKLRAANFSEQTDSENITWLFLKSSGSEFSELHYYY